MITGKINEPYIYVLFLERYPPALFQNGPILRVNGLFGTVIAFGRYGFLDLQRNYRRFDHGIFVFRGGDELPKAPAFSVRYPDGRVAYSIVVK
ncbi:MAG: hypothetical protein WA005_02955 [Candidatus Binataceae bacterium]